MNARLLMVVLLMSPAAAAALDGHLYRGLDVVVDEIGEPVVVDGVQMAIQRFSGSGVPELANRVESSWKSHGSVIRSMQQGRWTLRSRMRAGASEVVQWRADPGGPELVWSSVDVTAPVHAAIDTRLSLPATCIWGRSVSGRSVAGAFLQRSARCSLPLRELLASLRNSTAAQGWRVRSATNNGLLLDRPGAEGMLSLSRSAAEQVSWLSWLHVEH